MIANDIHVWLKMPSLQYQHLEMFVERGHCISNSFILTNGVSQGGVLSPSEVINYYTKNNTHVYVGTSDASREF